MTAMAAVLVPMVVAVVPAVPLVVVALVIDRWRRIDNLRLDDLWLRVVIDRLLRGAAGRAAVVAGHRDAGGSAERAADDRPVAAAERLADQRAGATAERSARRRPNVSMKCRLWPMR